MQQVATMGSGVRYSGRTGKRPEIVRASRRSSIATSPVWPLAAIVFAAAYMLHDLAFAVAVVIVQFAAMTAVQWLVFRGQAKALKIGLPPFRTLQLLRWMRLGAFWGALSFVLFS